VIFFDIFINTFLGFFVLTSNEDYIKAKVVFDKSFDVWKRCCGTIASTTEEDTN